MKTFFADLLFLLQRVTLITVLDILLVAAVFYIILRVLRDTQAVVLLRGILFLFIIFGLSTTIFNLPAFSWLIRISLPALLFAIPVIFAPEIRRGLERIGRLKIGSFFLFRSPLSAEVIHKNIETILTACEKMADHRYGALIVVQQNDNLNEYIRSGVKMDAVCSTELLLQIFYPNTPLHDGAVVIVHNRIKAAGCVMPLSDNPGINRSPERETGLRHRAALGISEASDAIALVVSEETGSISLAYQGRLVRRISSEKLRVNLTSLLMQSANLPNANRSLAHPRQKSAQDLHLEGK